MLVPETGHRAYAGACANGPLTARRAIRGVEQLKGRQFQPRCTNERRLRRL